MKKLATAVIGVGHVGKEHARIYSQLPGVELVGLCDIDLSKKAKADELHISFYTDHRELIPKVEAVSIAVPTSKHYQIAHDFLQAGVHTLIEKPITTTLEQADHLIQIAKEKNVVMQVGHIERYNVAFCEVKKIAHDVRFVEIHRLGPFSPRINDCGVVLDLMIHDLDILLSLVDSEIESLDAIGVNVLTPYEDIANVRIKFKNGAIADLTASRLTPERQRKIRIFQENTYISLDYETQSAQIFKKVGDHIEKELPPIQKEEPLKKELQNFISSIQTNTAWGKPDLAARNALALALRILELIQSNIAKYHV